jgi:hypothetical protein
VSKELRFLPEVWHKVMFLCHDSATEVGGMCISGNQKDPLLVTDFVMPKQSCTTAYTEFDDQAFALYCEDCLDKGLVHGQFDRIWLHFHPKGISGPSGTDENTFTRVFGTKDWAVMAILPKDGTCYARLRVSTPLGSFEELLTVKVDYGSDDERVKSWRSERDAVVSLFTPPAPTGPASTVLAPGDGFYKDYLTRLERRDNHFWDDRYGDSSARRHRRRRPDGRFARGGQETSFPDGKEIIFQGIALSPLQIDQLKEDAEVGALSMEEVRELLSLGVLAKIPAAYMSDVDLTDELMLQKIADEMDAPT